MRARRGLAMFHFPEEPDQKDAHETENGGPAENVDECPQEGLLTEAHIKSSLGAVHGVGGIEVVAQEPGKAAHLLLKA